MKGVKILLTPELLADTDGVRAAFKVAWDAFDKAGYEDCRDGEGNVPVSIFVGTERVGILPSSVDTHT